MCGSLHIGHHIGPSLINMAGLYMCYQLCCVLQQLVSWTAGPKYSRSTAAADSCWACTGLSYVLGCIFFGMFLKGANSQLSWGPPSFASLLLRCMLLLGQSRMRSGNSLQQGCVNRPPAPISCCLHVLSGYASVPGSSWLGLCRGWALQHGATALH